MSNTATNIPAVYPGGSSGQIQYNNSGIFGAVTGTTSDGANITGMSIKSSFDLKGSASGSITISGGSSVTSHSLILPSAIGAAGQVLGINNVGTGQLQWGDSQIPGWSGSLYTSSPNNTVNASKLIAFGGTTNQDAVICTKGTGAFQLQVADGTATGGNKRGAYAVDLQMIRVNANQVASGAYSFCAGGNNRSVGDYSCSAGISNTSSGLYSTAFGYLNTSSGASATSLGATNTASGDDSLALGYGNVSSGGCSISMGYQSNAKLWSQFTLQGHVPNSMLGKLQQFLINSSGLTTDNISQELFLDGYSLKLSVFINTTYLFKILVLGHGTNNTDVAAYEFTGVISNRAGTTAIVGTVTKTAIVETDSSWDADVTADDTNDALIVTVTGANSKNISWEAAHWIAQVTT